MGGVWGDGTQVEEVGVSLWGGIKEELQGALGVFSVMGL